MKFCQDCKYPEHRNALGNVSYNSMCAHPKATAIHTDIVTGTTQAWARSCSEFRRRITANDENEWCGPEAKFFEPLVSAS